MNQLATYISAWKSTMDDTLTLLPTLTDEDWDQPTDCPLWSVRDVAAHLAHFEAELAGLEVSHAKAGSVQVTSDYTQLGVDERRDRSPSEIISEIAAAVPLRAEFLSDMPADPQQIATPAPGGIRWTWDTLLRNRAIDAWVHEQDIRRAVGRPGNLGSGGAQVTAFTFAAAMPYVLGKKAGAEPGTSVKWEITGEVPMELGAVIGEDGRAVQEIREEPTVSLSMTTEVFTILGAGRRSADQVPVRVRGDSNLARRVLDAMPLTF